MSAHLPSRIQSGTPAGGQFATALRSESDVQLDAATFESMMEWLSEDLYDSEGPPDDAFVDAADLVAGEHVDLEAAVYAFTPQDLVGSPADAFVMVADAREDDGAVHLSTDRALVSVPAGYVVPRALQPAAWSA